MLPLTEAEQQWLLSLARQAVTAAASGELYTLTQEAQGNLAEHCGAFVTLRKWGELRGCIGQIEALKPLYETVRECATAAALYDPRFDPVNPHEIPDLNVEISVLSPLVDISADQIEIGRHGLLISQGDHRGVLLPQVPVELGWDREQFLNETCVKAGLPQEAWRHGARTQGFTAQIFSEAQRSWPVRNSV